MFEVYFHLQFSAQPSQAHFVGTNDVEGQDDKPKPENFDRWVLV